MKTKWCYACGAHHRIEAFSRDKNRADGLQPRCREAARRYSRGEPDVMRNLVRVGVPGWGVLTATDELEAPET